MKCALLAMLCAQQTAACNCNGACVSTVGLETSLTDDPASLTGDTITVCKNSDCASATLGELSGSDRTDVLLGGDFSADAVFTPNGSDVSLEVQLTDVGPFQDGDTYSVDIVAPDDTSVLARTGSATYEHTSLCGTQCSQAIVDL